MKLYIKSLLVLAVISIAAPAFSMEEGQQSTTLSAQLQKKVRENEDNYKDDQFFSLFIIQPSEGYKTLWKCVDHLFRNGQFPENYKRIPSKYYHMTLATFAVPYSTNNRSAEVQKAVQALKEITADVLPLLDLVSYRFKEIKGIGTNKFIAAYYDFTQGKDFFYAAYELIVARFLAKYPKTWMRYGYSLVPHVSIVVRKRKEQPQKVVVQTSQPQVRRAGLGSGRDIEKVTIPFTEDIMETKKCINVTVEELNLLHKGRDLKISGDFYDQEKKKLERIETTVST